LTPVLPGFNVTLEVSVVWGEMDAFEHVNNVVYFRYFESVRMAYFERMKYTEHLAATRQGPILASTSCRFKRPLSYPDTLTLGAKVTDLQSDRFTMAYALWSHRLSTVAATGVGEVVHYDYETRKRCELPSSLASRIRAIDGLAE
jgi:acyl-CoA thioester hydrolase